MEFLLILNEMVENYAVSSCQLNEIHSREKLWKGRIHIHGAYLWVFIFSLDWGMHVCVCVCVYINLNSPDIFQWAHILKNFIGG